MGSRCCGDRNSHTPREKHRKRVLIAVVEIPIAVTGRAFRELSALT